MDRSRRPKTRGGLAYQSDIVRQSEAHVRATCASATMDGLDMTTHLVLLADCSTKLGHFFASSTSDVPPNEDGSVVVFTAIVSKTAFAELLGGVSLTLPIGWHTRLRPSPPDKVTVVCITEDIGFFEVTLGTAKA